MADTPAASMTSTARASTAAPPPRNEVHLTGRLAGPPLARELPSGDEIVAFRLVVPRDPARRPRGSAPTRASVDTIDCTVWTPALRRSALRCAPGEHLEVAGALRRRFWSGPAGRSSTYGVEVTSLRRVARPSGGA